MKKLFFLFLGLAILAVAKMYFYKKTAQDILPKNKDVVFQASQEKLHKLDSVYSIQQEAFIAKLLNKYATITQFYQEKGSLVFIHEKDSARLEYVLQIEPFFEKNVLKAHIVWYGRTQILDKMQFLYECHNGKWSQIYADNSQNCIKFADVNGDNYQDILIRHYPQCGHSMHNWVEVLMYNPIKKRVEAASDGEFNENYLSNPTFYPKKGIALCNETCNLAIGNEVYQVKFKNYKWHFVERIYIPLEDTLLGNLGCDHKYHRCKKENLACNSCPSIAGLPKIYESLEVYEGNDSTFFAVK
jgi:hypothetical protein